MALVLTEFDESVYMDLLRKEVRAEAREEGQADLVNAINRIRNGETVQDLIDSGVDSLTANLAYGCR